VAVFILGLMGLFASTGDGSNPRDWGSAPGLGVFVVTVGNSFLGALVVLLVAGIDKIAGDD